jgi:predicted nucleic acid-binding protein
VSVVVNTTILSNFASVGRLGLLRSLLGTVYIPTAVYAEVQEGLADGYQFYEAVTREIQTPTADPWLRLTAPTNEELRIFTSLLGALHHGEAECVAITATRGWAFLTDDARTRKEARRMNVRVSGTLGLLVQAVKTQQLTLDEANALLAQMMDAGYYSPYDNLAELL